MRVCSNAPTSTETYPYPKGKHNGAVGLKYAVVQILVHSDFDLVTLIAALEATGPVSEPLLVLQYIERD